MSCNFGCMLLEHSLLKSVVLLAYILYCLKKYMSRGCAYFVVLGGMIFKSMSFSLNASSSTCSSLCPEQEPQSTSEFVDKCGFKTYRKRSSGVPSSYSQSHLHLRRHLEGIRIYSEDICIACGFYNNTSRARLHSFADKLHSPAHSEVHNGLVTKISYIYVCSNPNTFLVRPI